MAKLCFIADDSPASIPRYPSSSTLGLCIGLGLLILADHASAATSCANPQLQPLQQPQVFSANNGVLDTSMIVRMKDHPCVPVWDATNNRWTTQSMTLRTYGHPIDPKKPFDPENPNDPNLAWTFPGPTFQIHKGSAPGATDGDRVRIKLYNRLPVAAIPDDQCDPGCPPSNPNCGVDQEFPSCMHGDNTTNLHYHGFHVSPQPPQDYVLLQIKPPGAPNAKHMHGEVVEGSYQYDIDPIPWDQAEGTHWYHAHKHGSTALQMINGMSGAFRIFGPFDEWLNGYYDNQLVDQMLVIQQINPIVNFFTQDPNYAVPHPLVNGQANPVITMNPGEVQRWRFVNGTIQSSAQLLVGFESSGAPQYRQIAMDGVQFSPDNYGKQQLLARGLGKFKLSPGNRIDLLVKAPSTPGTYVMTHKLVGALDELRPEIKQRLQLQRQELAQTAASTNPPLLTVIVTGSNKSMNFPTQAQWPATPPFLSDITSNEIVSTEDVLYSMKLGPANPKNAFFINNKQYDPDCADFTMTLDTAEEWVVSNSSSPNHPFHIHVNPFQLREVGTIINGTPVPFITYDPPIWQDTEALPSVNTTWDVNAGPIWNNDDAKQKCPNVCTNASGGTWNGQWTTTVPGEMSVCGCSYTGNGYFRIRHRFEDFTGEYVQHCHFLGHEDRGMMLNVQTVCPPPNGDQFGKANPGKAECVAGNFTPAASKCK